MNDRESGGIPYFVVDAFTDTLFSGNPAGVCVVPRFPSDACMQQIAAENALAETAFLCQDDKGLALRWFTPCMEVPLCGHGTLASAYVWMEHIFPGTDRVVFHTQSGALTVTCTNDLYEMDFPSRQQTRMEISGDMQRAIDAPIMEAYEGYNLMLRLENQQAVAALRPDMQRIAAMDAYHGVIVTAKGDDCDFVSRFFVPRAGVDEDYVTGSTHTSLAPYWGERLGKDTLIARQLSSRGGMLRCRVASGRVFIAGKARLYMRGELMLGV